MRVVPALFLLLLCTTAFAQLDVGSRVVVAKIDDIQNQRLAEHTARLDRVEATLEEIRDLLKANQGTTMPTITVDVAAQRKPPAKVSASVQAAGLWTSAELRMWLHARYNAATPLKYTVSPRTAVRSHLTNGGNHAFTNEQVAALAHWEQLALHDAHHKKLISPWRAGTATGVAGLRPVATVGGTVAVPIIISRSAGCANGYCARPAFQAMFNRKSARKARKGR